MILEVKVIALDFPMILYQTSVITIKPRDPAIAKTEMVQWMRVFSEKLSKLSLNKLKPAVQKEETLWNKENHIPFRPVIPS
jgi:hypothetical protein